MRFLLAFLLIGLLAEPSAAQAPSYDLPIQEHVFDNGLRLLVLEQPGNPRVACKIFFDMGAMNEVPGELGSAHFLEHLMFKGTHTLGTTDWEAERPLIEKLYATEAELIEARNRARNDLRQRGVFHDYSHATSTPEIDSLQREIERIDKELAPYRDGGAMMRWYQAFGGAHLTATTEQEYMKFDINLPANRTELFLRVEADRMQNSVFREFDQERMILVEQRYGDLNRATTPYYEALNAVAQTVHPVYWPEGYLPDFQVYTRHYERDLYREYFVVNNATLVFIGGVTMEELIPQVEQYFGSLEPAPEPTRIKAVEPLPQAERRMIWRSTDLAPRVEVRYGIPGIGHPDRPAFDVLAEVASVQLADALQAAGVSASTDVNTRVVHTSRFGVPATLNMEVVLEDEADLEKAEATLFAALNDLAQQPTSSDELAMAKKRLRTAWYRTAAEPDQLAFEIGHFQVMDRWQTLEDHLNAREAATADHLQRLAQTYFVPENRTVGIVRRPEENHLQTEAN